MSSKRLGIGILTILASLLVVVFVVTLLARLGSVSTTPPTTVAQPETSSNLIFTVVSPPEQLYADRNVRLAWEPIPGANAYSVELWGGIYNRMTPCRWIATTYCQIGQMWKGNTYSWQVIARTNAGAEIRGPEWTFTISKDGPPADAPGCLGAPVLLMPDGAIVAKDMAINLLWSPPNDCQPDGYTFRINTSNDPEEKPWIIDTGVGDTIYTYTFAPGIYHLHVRACKSCTPYDPGAWNNHHIVVK